MKKLFLSFAVVAGIVLASCGNKTEEATDVVENATETVDAAVEAVEAVGDSVEVVATEVVEEVTK